MKWKKYQYILWGGGLKQTDPCLFEAGKIFGTGNIQTGKKFPEKYEKEN